MALRRAAPATLPLTPAEALALNPEACAAQCAARGIAVDLPGEGVVPAAVRLALACRATALPTSEAFDTAADGAAPPKVVLFSADGARHVLVGSSVRVTDAAGAPLLTPQEVFYKLTVHDPVPAALDAAGKRLALPDEAGGLWLWDLDAGTPPRALARAPDNTLPSDGTDGGVSHGPAPVKACAFSPDGGALYALYADARLVRFSVAGAQETATWCTASGEAPPPPARDRPFTPDFSLVAAAGVVAALADRHGVTVLSAQGLARRASWCSGGRARRLELDAGAARLLVLGARCVEVWQTGGAAGEPPSCLCTVYGHSAGSNSDIALGCAALSPDGTRLATAGSADAVVRVWDTASGALLASLPFGVRKLSAVTTLAWSADGARLAAAGRSVALRVWDAAEFAGCARLPRPARTVPIHHEWPRPRVGELDWGRDVPGTTFSVEGLAFTAPDCLRLLRCDGGGVSHVVTVDAGDGGASAAAPAAQPKCTEAARAKLMEALLEAMRSDHLKELLKHLHAAAAGGCGIDDIVAAPDGALFTVLFGAASWARVETVALLLQLGADVAAVLDNGKRRGFTPLHMALSRPSDDMGGDVVVKNLVNARVGRIAELMLDAGAPLGAASAMGITPLHLAAQGDYAEVVEALLERGAPMNAVDEHGCTPLMYAASTRASHAAERLLFWGADASLRDKDGDTVEAYGPAQSPHSLFGFDGGGKLTETLRRAAALDAAGRAQEQLLFATMQGRPDLVEQALAAGAKAAHVYGNGTTCLHVAAASTSYLRHLGDGRGYYRVQHPVATLHVLLGACAPGEADAPNEKGHSALCEAFKDDEFEHFRALLDGRPDGRGDRADPNAPAWPRGATPLVHMARKNDGGDGGEFLVALRAAGACLDHAVDDTSPLLACVRSDAAPFARALLAAGANMLHAVGGVTPLGAARHAASAGVSAVNELFRSVLRAVATDAAAPLPRLTALLAEPAARGADHELWAGDVAAVLAGSPGTAARITAAAPGARLLPELNEALCAAMEDEDDASFAAALEAGADARLVISKHPYGPLYVAVSMCNARLARRLIDAGADVRTYEARMRGGLLECALNAAGGGCSYQGARNPLPDMEGAIQMFKLLLEHGANANCGFDTDTKYQAQVALLHWMAGSDNVLPLTTALLDSGRCDVNVRDVNGSTPLFWASRAPETAMLLVARGADIWARNRAGALAWEAHTSQGHHELPASDEDRARLKRAIDPVAEEPEESRARKCSRMAAPAGGGAGSVPPELAMLQGVFGGAWLANKLGQGRRGAGGNDSDSD